MNDSPNNTEGDDDGSDVLSVIVPEDEAGQRLDKFLAAHCDDLSRARIQALMGEGQVSVNGTPCGNTSQKTQAGSSVEIIIPPPQEATPEPENIPLDIVYEDGDMLVINKQAGLVVHPGAGNWSGTLVNALLYHCGDSLSGIGGVIRPGIVHRLDKDTSGLMVAAKNDKAHRSLSAQLSDRSLSRHYYALVWGVPPLKKGVIDAPIGRHPMQRQKMAVTPKNARHAVTHYIVRERYGDAVALVECKLETGRTHQVRVHMAHLGYPLVGDPIYGAQATKARSLLKKSGYDPDDCKPLLDFPRQALHAFKIGFIHPSTGQDMFFEIDLSSDMAQLKITLNQ